MMLAGVPLLAGCPRRPEQQPAPPVQREEPDITALVGQWAGSDHANILLLPAGRDGCVSCHDGGAYAAGLTEQAQLERDFFVSIDCRACHTGRGQELLAAGAVNIPTAENVRAGLGAQCLSCHNERRAPDIADVERRAPHPSSQAGLFTATGGIRAEGFAYGSTGAHANLEDTCVACHMTEAREGFRSHTFAVDDVQAACGRCHQGITAVNLSAAADYDGDGNTEGFQDEVQGLLDLLKSRVAQELAGGTFESAGGRIIFKNAAGEEVQVPNELYQAAYNHLLASQDGSLGVHNPLFTVQLLQQSYRMLTGENVPNAAMR
jgi:nitrate/TMAO reductase-like tetraheme cytochrome c subunit